MIGYYDRLSSNLSDDKSISSKKLQDKIIIDEPIPAPPKITATSTPKLTVSRHPTRNLSQIPKLSGSTKPTSFLFSSPALKQTPKTIQFVSPNVQRMISSHQTTTETTTADPPLVKSFIHDLNVKNTAKRANAHNEIPLKISKNQSSLFNKRLARSNQSNGGGTTSNIHIPLTKSLCKKISQNGFADASEPIVHTITDNNEYLDLNNGSRNDLVDSDNSKNYESNLIEDNDNDKTPTNSDNRNKSFIYDNLLNKSSSQELNEDDDLQILNKTSELSQMINDLINSGDNYDNYLCDTVNLNVKLNAETREKLLKEGNLDIDTTYQSLSESYNENPCLKTLQSKIEPVEEALLSQQSTEQKFSPKATSTGKNPEEKEKKYSFLKKPTKFYSDKEEKPSIIKERDKSLIQREKSDGDLLETEKERRHLFLKESGKKHSFSKEDELHENRERKNFSFERFVGRFSFDKGEKKNLGDGRLTIVKIDRKELEEYNRIVEKVEEPTDIVERKEPENKEVKHKPKDTENPLFSFFRHDKKPFEKGEGKFSFLQEERQFSSHRDDPKKEENSQALFIKESNFLQSTKFVENSEEEKAITEEEKSPTEDKKPLLSIEEGKPVAASPKLSYSRAKLLSNHQIDSPTNSPKLAARKSDEINSSNGKLNGSPSSKHRPLSAASITSSSSSSSGSTTSSNSFSTEHLTNKVTYLASIESLADHSENESLENHSLTMSERAALEIIQSEKSYVDDLGEIIRG